MQTLRGEDPADSQTAGGASSPLRSNVPTNLPALRTHLIGRERELDQLHSLLLRDEVGLLTLTGLGGAGKTSLALHAVSSLLESFPEGVFFINLAPLRHPESMLGAIAQSLGLQEAAGQPVRERLRDFLHGRPILLVLDNLEQLLDGVQEIGALLDDSPLLKVLATSREALRLRGEQVYVVGPLTSESAAELFAQRARSLNPGFMLTAENRPAVDELCRRLDRLPLAIELAALRTRIFTPQALLARLERELPSATLDLLSGGARDLPPRQQTLRDTIAWSYGLLDPAEQRVFRVAGVFPAGFGLHTMGHLAGGGDTDLLANLTSLVDKNLIQPAPAVAAEPRFVLLETIREFSVEQARAAGEWDDLQRRLLSYYAEFTLRSTHGLQGSESGTWLKSLDAEHANLTAAIDWALDSPAGSEAWRAGLTILGNLRRYWMLRGHFHLPGQSIERGRAAIQSFETSETSADSEPEDTLRLKAGILALAGSQSWALGEYERSRDWHRASFELYRRLGDEQGMGDALNNLAVSQDQLGEHDRAFEHHQQGLELYRKIGDRWGEMRSLNNLGRNLEGLGRAEQALQFLESGLAIAEEQQDDFFLAALLCNIGHVRLQLGQYDQAEAALERCVERVELREYGYLRAWALADLADVRVTRDQLGPAAQALRECLRMMEGFGDNNLRQSALMVGAALLMKAGKAETAACIMGSLDEMLIRARARRTPYEQAQYEALIRKIRLGQSRQQFDAAWRRGRASSIPEMIVLALVHIEASPAPAADDELRLSRREQDVLRLLARGMTNQQIADELVIVVKTVEKHVAGILVKLGVRNRTQAAASAAARRLMESDPD